MKLKKHLSLAFIATFLCAFTANAAVYTQGAIGDDDANIVTVTTGNVAAADDIAFQTSAQVRMSGNTSATAFAHGAYHTQVEGKKNGRQFAMASESSSIFWQSIDTGDNAVLDIDETGVDQFTTWEKM